MAYNTQAIIQALQQANPNGFVADPGMNITKMPQGGDPGFAIQPPTATQSSPLLQPGQQVQQGNVPRVVFSEAHRMALLKAQYHPAFWDMMHRLASDVGDIGAGLSDTSVGPGQAISGLGSDISNYIKYR